MALQALPPELLELVMVELVKSSPVEVSWKLRHLVRGFYYGIPRLVLTILPQQAFDSPATSMILEASNILGDNLAYCLAARVESPKSRDGRPELLKKVAIMAEYLYKKLGASDGISDDAKWKILMRLCTGLSSRIRRVHPGGDKVRQLLWLAHHDYQRSPSEKDIIGRDFGIGDQVVACLAIGDHALIGEMLPHVPNDTFFGIYDFVLLDTIMNQLNTDRSGSRREKRALLLGDSVFSVKGALDAAIALDKITFLRRLPEFTLIYVTHLKKSLYMDLLESAVYWQAEAEFVWAIFDTVAKDRTKHKYRAPLSLFRKMCSLELNDGIVALIKFGGIDVNSTESESAPLVLAIRSGSETSVAAVLTAGADIDLPIHPQQGKMTLTALEYASSHCGQYKTRYWAVDYLLSHGAALPALSAWPLYRTIYNKYREAKHSREGVLVPEWKLFKRMTDAERAAL